MKPLPESLKRLRKRLNHRDENTREQAFQEALALPPETLLQLAEAEAKLAHIQAQAQETVGSLGCVWILIGFATVVAQFVCHTAFLLWDALLVGWLPVFIGMMGQLEARNRLRGSFSRAILTQTNPGFVAPALLFYHHLYTRESFGLHTDMRQTLMRLLPLVTLQDAEAWTAAHKMVVRQFISFYNLEMLRSALQALERVGNAEDVSTLRKVADLTPEQITAEILPYTHVKDREELCRAILASITLPDEPDAWNDAQRQAIIQDARYIEWCSNQAQDIHALANRSLAAILERSEQQKQAAGLLRPSSAANTDAAHILLRPQVEPESQTPPEQLLRPTVKNS